MKIYASILGLALSVLTIGCQTEQPAEKEAPAIPAKQAVQQSTQVKLTQNQMKTAKIQLGKISERSLSNLVHANGYFDVPPQNKADISTFVAGYIKKTYLLEGDQVKKGQIMAVLENPEFIQKQQNFLEIKGQLEYLKSEFERQKQLDDERITAKKNRIKAEAEYNTTLATYNGLKEQLNMMGINMEKLEAGNITSTINIIAPISGSVTSIDAVIGKFVEPSMVMFQIVNTDHMHIELNVYEKDVMNVRKGQKVTFTIPGQTDKEFTAEVHLVGKSFTNEDRTVKVHAHFDDKEASFLPGMYVDANIMAGDEQVAALPQQAVVQEDDQAYIFVKLDTDSFRKVDVSVGKTNSGWVEIKPEQALNSQDSVVLNGVYYLNSEYTKSL